LMKRMGAGCVISEFVSAHAVVQGRKKSRYLSFHEDERPVGIQLFGGDEAILADAAKIIEQLGLDFVDLNLGCPVPKVTKKGGGSAWLCHPVDLGKMLAQVKQGLSIPLTIKIRTGWDEKSLNAKEIVHIAESEGVHWVAIHGRTRAQGYAGNADWDFIEEIASSVKIPIIGNGDVINGIQAAARQISSKCAGVMIGRGALKNPWIFSESVEALRNFEALPENEREEHARAVLDTYQLPSAGSLKSGQEYYTRKVKKLQPAPVSFVSDWIKIRQDRDVMGLINLHLSLLREVYNEERVEFSFRKFLAWYAAGYPNAHQFRKYIFTTKDFAAVVSRAFEYFEEIKSLGKDAEISRENAPVLMSGHG
jgi:tRNA-dihydrouridine synthase B